MHLHDLVNSPDGPQFAAHAHRSAPPAARVVVAMAGEIDAATCGDARRAVTDVLTRDRPAHVSLDMQYVTFIDSLGIHALLLCQRDARQHSAGLDIGRAHRHVRQVLAITGLLEVFDLPAEAEWSIPRARQGGDGHRNTPATAHRGGDNSIAQQSAAARFACARRG